MKMYKTTAIFYSRRGYGCRGFFCMHQYVYLLKGSEQNDMPLWEIPRERERERAREREKGR